MGYSPLIPCWQTWSKPAAAQGWTSPLRLVSPKICLRHWLTAQRSCSLSVIGLGSANVDNVFFIFSTRARKELVGGVACSLVVTALKLPHTPNDNGMVKIPPEFHRFME